MTGSVSARRAGRDYTTKAHPRLRVAVGVVGAVWVAVWATAGNGPLSALARAPVQAASVLVGAAQFSWHFTGYAAAQVAAVAGRALGSLSYPWFAVLLVGCVILVATHERERRR
jgi:hypothetical protein